MSTSAIPREMPVFETFDELVHAFIVADRSSTLTPEERSEIMRNCVRQLKRFHVPSACEFFSMRYCSSYLAHAISHTVFSGEILMAKITSCMPTISSLINCLTGNNHGFYSHGCCL